MFTLVPRFEWGSDPDISIDSGAPLDIEWPEYQTSKECRYVIRSKSKEVKIEFDFASESNRLTSVTLIRANRSDLAGCSMPSPDLRTDRTLGWKGQIPDSTETVPDLALTIFDNALVISLSTVDTQNWDGGYGFYIGTGRDGAICKLALALPPHVIEWILGERGRYNPLDIPEDIPYAF